MRILRGDRTTFFDHMWIVVKCTIDQTFTNSVTTQLQNRYMWQCLWWELDEWFIISKKKTEKNVRIRQIGFLAGVQKFQKSGTFSCNGNHSKCSWPKALFPLFQVTISSPLQMILSLRGYIFIMTLFLGEEAGQCLAVCNYLEFFVSS